MDAGGMAVERRGCEVHGPQGLVSVAGDQTRLQTSR